MQESSSSFFSRIFNKIQTLENSQPLKYKQIFESALAARTRLSVDRPFLRSTGRSTGCPTESWVLSVGRPGGRPSSFLVHIVHAGRPGRSTGQPAPAAVGLFSAAVSLRLRRRFPRRSLDDPSMMLINFPISKLSLSNKCNAVTILIVIVQ